MHSVTGLSVLDALPAYAYQILGPCRKCWTAFTWRAMFIALMACYSTHTIADYSAALEAHRRSDVKALLAEVRKAVEDRGDRGYVALIHELYMSKKANRFEYGAAADRRAALGLLARAADEGPARAQFEIGNLLEWNGGGVEYWGKAARGGHPQAQYDYALFAGREGKISRKEEFEWIKKSAEQGYLEAQRRMVSIYLQDTLLAYRDVVPADPSEAFRWVKHVATREDLPLATRARDINGLAWMYFQGIGVEKDYCESFRLFSFLLEKGYEHEGENGLWRFYKHGYCTSPDAEKADAYYRRTLKRQTTR